MITPREIEKVTMSPEKKASAKNDYFAFYIGRPITYVITVPFLYLNISPNTVTWFSFIPVLVGLLLLWIGESRITLTVGWLSFFIWSMLDGVDGNIARYKKQFSKMGDTLDATAGYFAMAIMPLAAGIAAAHHPGFFTLYTGISSETFIILGALSGMWVIIPRLTMHKAINSTGEKNIGGVKDRKGYSISKILALNLTSPPGAVQLLLLLSIFVKTLDLYTVGYFILNTLVMVFSLRSIFRARG